MQMNYDSISLAERPVLVPQPKPRARGGAFARRSSTTSQLLAARDRALRAQSLEGAAWLAVALSALAVLVISLWG